MVTPALRLPLTTEALKEDASFSAYMRSLAACVAAHNAEVDGHVKKALGHWLRLSDEAVVALAQCGALKDRVSFVCIPAGGKGEWANSEARYLYLDGKEIMQTVTTYFPTGPNTTFLVFKPRKGETL